MLAALLVEIARLNRDSGEDKVAENAGKLTNMITSVLDYVSYHYMEDIKVEDLANICHISETHFRRVFTSYMKMSPLEYINTVRVYTACELLETTDAPVADVAHKCGFTTNSTFNRNFKQLMGVTPLEWRKRPESYEQQLLRFNIHSEKGMVKKEKGIIDMYDYKIVEQVSRKKKNMSGVLRKVMILFAVIFVIMGIAISQSFMLAGFLLAASLFCVLIFSVRRIMNILWKMTSSVSM